MDEINKEREEIIVKALSGCFNSKEAENDKGKIIEATDIGRLLNKGLPYQALPENTDSLAISISKPKTAALCYDRIWNGFENIPPSIGFFGNSSGEIELLSKMRFQLILSDPELVFGSLDEKDIDSVLASIVMEDFSREDLFDFLEKGVTNEGHYCKAFSRSISKEFGLSVSTIHSSLLDFNEVYTQGNTQIIVATLENMSLVNEELLDWEQVEDFRNDDESKMAFRRFKHWFNKELVGQPQSFIQDEICQRLDSYNKAINKHGMKVTVGTISRILDFKKIFTYISSYSALSWLDQDFASIVVPAIGVGVDSAIEISKSIIEIDEKKSLTNPEIAYVYKLEKLT